MIKNLTDIVKTAKNKALMTTLLTITGLVTYCGVKAMREESVEKAFQQTPASIELDSTYNSQRMAIDTPYMRQRMRIEAAYKFQKDSLKQVYINDLVGGK